MRHSRRTILLFLLWIPLFVGAQPTNEGVLARAELARKTIKIGDQLYLEINLSAPPGTEIAPLDAGFIDRQPGLEVIRDGELNVVAEQPELLLQQRFLITSFDTGYVSVPPLPYVFRDAAGQLDTALTDDLLMKVEGIPVTEENDIIHARDILEENLNWLDLWPLYLVLLAGGLIYGFIRYRKQLVKPPPPPPPPPPADFKALTALDALAAKQLWQQGKTKAYYSELTYILRDYLGGRFKVPALEMTTRQITSRLPEHPELRELLQLSDLVKFAKATPAEELHASSIQRVRTFVQRTAPGAEKEEE